MTQVVLIVAYNQKHVIADETGNIPWKIKEETLFFKETTMGCPCIMGRKTWQSIPEQFRPLPGRENLIVTTNPKDFQFPNNQMDHIWVMPSVELAIEYAERMQPKEIFVIGGAQIYNYCLENNLVKKVIASEVKNDSDGVTFFPDLKERKWKEQIRIEYEQFTVIEYIPN